MNLIQTTYIICRAHSFLDETEEVAKRMKTIDKKKATYSE